jgi:hypothetical protein
MLCWIYFCLCIQHVCLCCFLQFGLWIGSCIVFGFRLTTVKEKLELVHVDICDLLILFTIFGEFVMMFWF